MEIESVFKDIYKNRKWGTNFANMGSSGPGSDVSQAKEYFDLLQEFIDVNDIKSIQDIGCGDFQFMRNLVLKSETSYLGVDCVKSLVKFNNKQFGKENIKFKYKELSKHSFDYSELYILKDTLQHLTNEILYNFLDYITKAKLAKYILITNCCNQQVEDQDVPSIGQTRPLNAKMFPLKKYNPVILKEYNGKQVCLIITF
jgi:hypothetical protein